MVSLKSFKPLDASETRVTRATPTDQQQQQQLQLVYNNAAEVAANDNINDDDDNEMPSGDSFSNNEYHWQQHRHRHTNNGDDDGDQDADDEVKRARAAAKLSKQAKNILAFAARKRHSNYQINNQPPQQASSNGAAAAVAKTSPNVAANRQPQAAAVAAMAASSDRKSKPAAISIVVLSNDSTTTTAHTTATQPPATVNTQVVSFDAQQQQTAPAAAKIEALTLTAYRQTILPVQNQSNAAMQQKQQERLSFEAVSDDVGSESATSGASSGADAATNASEHSTAAATETSTTTTNATTRTTMTITSPASAAVNAVVIADREVGGAEADEVSDDDVAKMYEEPPPNMLQVYSSQAEHFEIVWSHLSYTIERKWYKKIGIVDKLFSHLLPGQTIDSHSSATSTASSSANMNDNQHQMHTSETSDTHLQQQLNLHQKSASDKIQIFKNLNGTIKSGQLTAILGPSGAGKTTLLNCLTGKLKTGVTGHINLNGANGKRLKMCTIPQKDHLLELLTVEENLWFASQIKNTELGFDHVKNIERVVDLLGLKRCRAAKIKKISGGQLKRVSIAQELLSNPDILVLDEPTSGLDSLTCFKTIQMLRELVELSASNDFMKPMAIIVTIHQPQPKVFYLFHHVYILANGGRVVYEGSPQDSLDTITRVTKLSARSDCSDKLIGSSSFVDPASFLIEIASEEYGLEPIQALSEYQCKMFREKNHNSHYQAQFQPEQQYNNLEYVCLGAAAKDSGKSGECDNLAFSHDSDLHQRQRVDDISSTTARNITSSGFAINIHNALPSSDINKTSSRRRKHRPLDSNSTNNAYAIDTTSNSSDCSSSLDYSQNQQTSPSTNASSSECNTLYMSEQLRYTQENNHSGKFWSHMTTLTHRTLLTTRRDPMLMTSRVLFHFMIPFLMYQVYGRATGAANACPKYEPEIDITQVSTFVESKRVEYMLEELHMSIENVSMFFIIMYAFSAAVLALNALSFPLNMQVLLKETRNGWYSMASYVVAKTLADLPLELAMPSITMALVYPLTGQPSSYMQWRMLTICLVMTLCSLIAQTQALILGALVMNSVQTAVFLSQASQLPFVILAGFTIRIKRLSEPLKLLSLTSFYRLGCEAITLTRYGFGICDCNPEEITGEPVKLVGIPDQLRNLAQFWIESANNGTSDSNFEADSSFNSSSANALTTTQQNKPDIFQHLANQLSYANSYGVNITSCDDVTPDRIRAINLNDSWLVARIWHLLIMLLIMKVLLYYSVKFSIGFRL